MTKIIAGKMLVFKSGLIAAWLLAAMCWSGCQKTELPPKVKEEPVFSVQAAGIGTLTAGDDHYLFTDFAKDTTNVLTFSGTFKFPSCTTATCPSTLRFEFRNLFTGTDVLPGEAFREGEYEYADQSNTQGTTTYTATFSVVDTTGFQSFFWDFNGTASATGAIIQQEYPDVQPVRVSLTSVSTNKVKATVNHLVSLSGSSQYPEVQIRIHPDSGKNVIQAIVTGPPIIDFKWFPDSTFQFLTIMHPFLNDSYAITVTDDFDNTASARVDSAIGVDKDFLTPNFATSVVPITSGDPLQLGKVAIQWMDNQGVIWRSDRKAQLPAAEFRVIASEPYDLNEKGQKTQKMTVVFKCTLYNDAGGMLPFEGSGVIAVAY